MTKILLSAGEASGDLHGAALAEAIRQQEPGAKIYALGGRAMAAADVELLYDIAALDVMGLVEIVRKLPQLRKVLAGLAEWMEREHPDVLVVIDYFGFNLRLALRAKALGIPVVYYIAPKIWAWGKGRARQVAAAADQVAAIFPFEVDLYQQAGAKVTFVGHPLLDIAKPQMQLADAYNYFAADPSRPVILLLPGSRRQEVESLLPAMLAAAAEIYRQRPECQFFLPLASTISCEMVQEKISAYRLPLVITSDYTYDLMKIANVALAASGTATLEAALLGTPSVIVYKMSYLTYLAAKLLVKIPWIGLPNIVVGRQILPELLQSEVTPAKMAAATLGLLQDDGPLRLATAGLAELRQCLGGGGAVQRTAGMVIAVAAGDFA